MLIKRQYNRQEFGVYTIIKMKEGKKGIYRVKF